MTLYCFILVPALPLRCSGLPSLPDTYTIPPCTQPRTSPLSSISNPMYTILSSPHWGKESLTIPPHQHCTLVHMLHHNLEHTHHSAGSRSSFPPSALFSPCLYLQPMDTRSSNGREPLQRGLHSLLCASLSGAVSHYEEGLLPLNGSQAARAPTGVPLWQQVLLHAALLHGAYSVASSIIVAD